MTRILLFFSLAVLFTINVNAQVNVINVDSMIKDSLDRYFINYTVVTAEPLTLKQKIEAEGSIQIVADGQQRDLYLYEDDIRAYNYTINGESSNPTLMTYGGLDENEDEVRLTLAEDFIYGRFGKGENMYFIEPARYYHPGALAHEYVIYTSSDTKEVGGPKTCGFEQYRNQVDIFRGNEGEREGLQFRSSTCEEVEIALASDFFMFQEYGSVTGVENRNIGVLNNVQTNYDDEFASEIQFSLVEQFVSNCSTCDPWTNSTDIYAVLNDFTAWGPSGFSATHDVATLWSKRNFDGSTIGLAWVGVICSSHRYNVCEDFSTNADYIRVLHAHELGHNFNASHDAAGTPYIMAPAVQNTNTWSSASLTDINAHVASRNCLASCGPPAPPIANFTSNSTTVCPDGTVAYYNSSTGSVDTYSWSFEGGTPSSSSLANPSVAYPSSGFYNVTLTVTNAGGSDTEVKTDYINVDPNGEQVIFYDNFESGLANWTVENPDGLTTWVSASNLGGSPDSKGALLRNYNYSEAESSPRSDALVSSPIDLSVSSNIFLDYHYGYTFFDSSHRDSVTLLISTDNGSTFNEVFAVRENGSGSLATRPNMTSSFTPGGSDDWCYSGTYGSGCLTFDISSYSGFTVLLKIENVSYYGNNNYVDEVVIRGDCTPAGILPVEWLNFEAVAKDRQVHLLWKTATEVNTREFFIERSDNGQDFVAIGSLPAANNSSFITDYEFIDPAPVKGNNYYRIRQVDQDEKNAYSEIRLVKVLKRAEFTIDRITAESYEITSGSSVTSLHLFNSQGRIVRKFTPGQQRYSLFVNHLPPGLYYLNGNTATSTVMEKILVVK